jgi:hypothetical protein
VGGREVLEAISEQSASILYFPAKIDLSKTPMLHWSWSKLNTIKPQDETVKKGDDFVARVYVVKKGGLFFWQTRLINYVWSYRHRKSEVWENPYAGKNSRMVALRDRNDPEREWFSETRNIIKDFKLLFDVEIRSIDGIAIMTDSDDTRTKAHALYGDVFFTDK